jgi:iron complex transport system permease protein
MTRTLPTRLLRTCGALALALAASVVIASRIGAVPVSTADVLALLGQKLLHLGDGPSQQLQTILWEIRFPRVILAAVVGCALSVAGGALQGMLLNPLADPYLVGVSAGAAVGASLAIAQGWTHAWGGFALPGLAFLGALITIIVVYRLALREGRVPVESFILAGVVVGSFMWAMVSFIMTQADQLSLVAFWLMGNLGQESGWTPVAIALPVVAVGAIGIYACSRDLNLLGLGEEAAQQLGVEVEWTKRVIIALTALVTAAAVCVSGIIGFVGLVTPHIARRLFGADHRLLLPAAGLLGAIFLIWADALARVVLAPMELPVGVITALLGAPFFCYLLYARRPHG